MMYGPDGGRLCRLNLRTGKVTNLIDDAGGGVRDPQVHYDGQRIVFSYRPGGTRFYHLYEINRDGSELRQLTDGPYDDYEPTYLPDGDLVFCSSRCNRFVQCWFTQVAILHRCDANGGNIRPVSANIEQDNTPWMLPDGRLLYMRWEYVDRSRVRYHHLWTVNPDGTDQMVFYGNMRPGTVMLDAKPIPGSSRVVASFSPGHGLKEHAGFVTLVDPGNGPDDRACARQVSREPEWRDPYPFSEGCFLVARDRKLWIMDGQGNAEPFYVLPPELARLDVHEPRPLCPRPREHLIESRVDSAAATGRLVLEDVTRGRNMAGVKRGEVKQLLVLETLPKPVNFSGSMEPISLGGTFTLPRILGTVPVEPDGSAYLEVPALRPLFFVALDADGLSVKRMQSFVSVMPGETVSCVGCHDSRTEAPPAGVSLRAMRRPASTIEAVDGQPDMFEFPRDIQPILDRHCVRCHNYEQFSGKLSLTDDRGPWYSHAYTALMSRGLVSHGGDADGNIAPRKIGSSASRVMAYLQTHHEGVELSARELQSIRLWIDSGAPYPATYAALGTGMVGFGPDADVLQRRCCSCHAPKDADRKEWPTGFRTHLDLLPNLTRPEKSLMLLAPLATESGGVALCKEAPVFKDRADPDYQTLLRNVQAAKTQLDSIRRFDMEGFRPNQHYVREMKRYGVLPTAFDLAKDPIDVYATDHAYWRSFWWRPRT